MPKVGRGQVKVRDFDGNQQIIDNDTDGTRQRQVVWAAGPIGDWGYSAGASGTVVVSGIVQMITASAGASAGSFTINGGDSIIVPAYGSITIEPRGEMDDPTLVFSGTDSYFIEYVS